MSDKYVEFEDTLLSNEKDGKLTEPTYNHLISIYGEPKFRSKHNYLIFKDKSGARPNLEFSYSELSDLLREKIL